MSAPEASGPDRPDWPIKSAIQQLRSLPVACLTFIGQRPWTAVSLLAATLLALPLLALVWIASDDNGSNWAHLSATVLPTALSNSFLLMLGAGSFALVIGTGTAWLITMYRFPGREFADRALVLPLAIPVYIDAYAYVDLLDYAGPVQSALRTTFGFQSPADYMFPEIRSLYGAVFLFAITLYPYVYLAARASFEQQSVCVLEVARTLGRTAGQTFWSVALPLARPALAAGSILVLMECLNDLGAVQHLGVQTLSASIFATWTQRGSLAGAAQISIVMMIVIVVILSAERSLRGGSGYQATTGRYRAIPFETVTGMRAFLFLTIVQLPVCLGFAIPFGTLVLQSIAHFNNVDWPGFLSAAKNSLVLATLTSAIALAFALLFAYTARIEPGKSARLANRVSGLGYALPGTVLAIGLISPLAAFDNTVDGWMRDSFGISTGLMLSGTLFAVTTALVIRFLAVALGNIEAGLGRISMNLDHAARALGTGKFETLYRIHLPILTPMLGAAALMVFVDAMKELPATLLLRPFDFDTLATYIYGLMATEQFEEASIGAVTIVLIGLLPVLLLHKAIADGRAASSPKRSASVRPAEI